MKLKSKRKKKLPARTAELGEERMNFFVGDCFARLDKLNEMYKEAGLNPITKSYALREAVVIWIEEQIRNLRKALNGELHAKKRK